jgi:glutamyl-tRNA synthetase
VVVDDDDMGITHVIRGDDHINNTPRQINLLKAMGRELPIYAHVPMILGDDGARLSKRHGAVGVMQYRDDGFLPDALLNYLVRLGWSYEDREIFSVDEMVEFFDIADVNKAASSFNTEKLLWLNQQYIKESAPEHIARLVSVHLGHRDIDPALGPDLVDVVKAQQERAKSLIELADICAFYYVDFDEYNQKSAKKAFKPAAIAPLEAIRGKLDAMEDWSRESIHDAIHAVVEELEIGFGKIGMPLRLAVTGGAPSPDLDLTLWLVGKEACLRRIDRAIACIQETNKDAE